VPGTDLFVSVLVVGEIRRGIDRLRIRDSAQAAAYERWLAGLRSQYEGRILRIDSEIAEEWGRLNVLTTVSAIDGLMAATAKVHALTFVTRNVADVARTGVAVLNPFEPQR